MSRKLAPTRVGRRICRNVSVLTSRNIGVPGGSSARQQEVVVEVEIPRAVVVDVARRT